MTDISNPVADSDTGAVYRYSGALHAEAVDEDGVFLLAESGGAIRLGGALIARMHPLLQRGATAAEIADAAGADIEAVDRALGNLTRRGAVTVAPADAAHRFWEYRALTTAEGAWPHDPLSVLASSTVVVHGAELPWAASLHQALKEGGFGRVQVRPWADPDPAVTTIYLVDDYRDERLESVNRAAVASGARWYLVKPAGGAGWFGPLFEPGDRSSTDGAACWQCLVARLDANRLVRNYLVQRNGTISAALPSSPLSVQLGSRLVAQHLAELVTDPSEGSADPAITVFDYLGFATTEHRLQRRPQCPVCGNPDLQSELQHLPVTVEHRPKLGDGDGGDRAESAADLVRRFTPFISPITGLVKQLTPVSSIAGLHAYQSGQNFAIAMTAVEHLRSGLRSAAAGKGRSDVQARASAIGEAIERTSGRYLGDEARVRARADELDAPAIMPNDIALFSERQFAGRHAWNARNAGFHSVCDPFDPQESIDWTPVWSLTADAVRYAPTASLFYGYPYRPGNRYASADSNGCAAGASREDAILQGFFELVERDSVAIWWYNRLRRPAIDLRTFDNPYFATWTERYRAAGRDTWVLDLTFDLGIPCVVAVSRRRDKSHEDILMAFGAHFDIETAISRAMTEMNQFLPAVIGSITDDDGYAYNAPEQVRWWREATLANQPYLAPIGPMCRRSDYPVIEPTTLDQDVHRARRCVEAAGLELMVLDQTRPDAGLPVVRVLAPGMRHFWTRFAPGRLYEVPTRLGLLRSATAEEDLNPIGMFL